MSHGAVYLLGFVAAWAIAIWYDNRVEERASAAAASAAAAHARDVATVAAR